MSGKTIAVVGCLGVAFILFIAGTATGAMTKSLGNNYKYTATVWKTCITGPNGYNQCTDTAFGVCKAMASAIDAARAFDILAIIAAGVSAMCAALVAFVPAAAAALARVPWGMAGGAASALFSLIAFAITVSLYTQKQCGASMSLAESKTVDVGPNAPLYIVGCILCVVATVIAALNRGEAPKAVDVV